MANFMQKFDNPYMRESIRGFTGALASSRVEKAQAQQRRMAGDAYMGDPQAMKDLMQINPQEGMKIYEAVTKRKQEAKQQQIQKRSRYGEEMKSFVENVAKFDTFEDAERYGSTMVADLVRRYPEMSKNTGVDQTFDEEDFNQAKQLAKQDPESARGVSTTLQEIKYLDSIKDPEKRKEKEGLIMELKGRNKIKKIGGDSFLVGQDGSLYPLGTPGAEVEFEKEKASAKVTAKGFAGRQQGLISTGFEAADSMANINRGIELLDEIKTGGVHAVSLKVKQLFGVEGADEAELSSRLGKAVLSQLKPIFGAQFTKEEGKRLERIEAGFGKSTEGNKRLLMQVKRIVERTAKRGIRAAKKVGDFDTAKEIEDALNFSLTPVAPKKGKSKVIRFNREGKRIE